MKGTPKSSSAHLHHMTVQSPQPARGPPLGLGLPTLELGEINPEVDKPLSPWCFTTAA